MPPLSPTPATYQRRREDELTGLFKQWSAEFGEFVPIEAITIRCSCAPDCRGNGGHFVRFRNRVLVAASTDIDDDDLWFHIAPRGFVRDDQNGGRASRSKRAAEQTRRGYQMSGRVPHGRAGDLTARDLGPRAMPADSWFLGTEYDYDKAQQTIAIETQCTDCRRRLSAVLEDALRAT